MKRDMDLARKILFLIEASEVGPRAGIDVDVPGYDKKAVFYHIMLLSEAGLIEAEYFSVLGMGEAGYEWRANRLTWEGHEFLDAARSDTLWQKAKEKTGKLAGGVTFDILKEVLVQGGREVLGLAA
ncbi:MAG: DUF2513 domain-containing protein [Rhodospirillales bacterium]|nr:DUF2513 domain-containing protein [Rhodospirillales bacterium]